MTRVFDGIRKGRLVALTWNRINTPSAVSQGITADIDATAWKIVDGKLYLNLSPEAAAIWESDMQVTLSKAMQTGLGLRINRESRS